MTKKRGAQPDNQNALKHGFYAKQFKPSERQALRELSATDLQDEIHAMRVHFLRFLPLDNQQAKDLDYKTHLSRLRAMSIYTGRLASLLRIQNGGAKSKLEQTIEDALHEIREELEIE